MKLLAKEFYIGALKEINELQLTGREMDVLACIMHNKGEKKIASILDISPSTVNTHTYNIMNKLGYHSREAIINFIESSKNLAYIRGYYFYLLINSLFKKSLKKIREMHAEKIKCSINYNELSSGHTQALQNLTECLKLANVTVANTKDADFKINIIDRGPDFVENGDPGKINFIIDNCNDSPSKDPQHINFSDTKEFYNSVFKLIQKILGSKYDLSVVFKNFENDYDVLRTSWESGLIIKNNNKSNDSRESRHKPYLKSLPIIIVGFVFILLTEWILHINSLQSPFSSAEPTIDKQSTPTKSYTELDKIFSVIEEHKLLSDNLTAEKLHENYTIIKQFEQIDKNYSGVELANYFSLPDNSQKLVIYLYIMQAAASYYNYKEYDNIKAINMLIKGKDLAEAYINSMDGVQINFDILSAEELLNELEAVKALPEMYTRILYTLGRSYMFQEDFQKASYCFITAEYLGNKLGLFEGYLSKYKGLMELERRSIASDIKDGKKHEAKNRLLALLEMYGQYKNDKRSYIINYYPHKKPMLTLLQNSMRHMIECGAKSVQLYSMLLSITDDTKERLSYTNLTLKEITGDSSYPGILYFINKVNSRKKAEVINILGEILIQIYDDKINLKEIKTTLNHYFKFKHTDDLDFIIQLFEQAQLDSKVTDYPIKNEVYKNLIKVYEKKINANNLTDEQKNKLMKTINELKLKKTHIENLYK